MSTVASYVVKSRCCLLCHSCIFSDVFLPEGKCRSKEIVRVFRWDTLTPVIFSFNVLALSWLGFLFPKGYLEDSKAPQRYSGGIPTMGLVSRSEQRVLGCHNGGPPGR